MRDLQVFEQEVEDVEDWINDMEKQLASQDLGRDLISVNNLLKSHNVRNTSTNCILNAAVIM